MKISSALKNIAGRDIPLSALILAISLLLASVLVMIGVMGIKTNTNTIVSTGSARESVIADLAKISGDISVRIPASELKYGYSKIGKDKEKVLNYLTKMGAKSEEITFGSAYAGEVWTNDNSPRQFDIKQSITVQSSDLDLIQKISDNSNTVIQEDVFLQMYAVEYYYSKLPDMRRELLGKAVADAKIRAQEIAKSAGNKVGELKSARAGVVQVLAPNSQNVDDYGTYDTSTIDKDIVVSVNATFYIK